MFNKKKMHFWRLVFIFGALILITLFLLWSGGPVQKASMMESSMAGMMQSMHLSNITIYSLFDAMETQQEISASESQQLSQEPGIYQMSILTTSIIFILLPFIIGGAIILGIVWIK